MSNSEAINQHALEQIRTVLKADITPSTELDLRALARPAACRSFGGNLAALLGRPLPMAMDSHDGDFDKLKSLLEGITYAMLTTRAADGALVSRPMASEEVDPTGELWFFTDARSQKAQSINDDPDVCVSYAAPDADRFVSISGTGLLIRDRERMARLWKPGYRAWFPNGLEDPDLTLLCVKIQRVAYWDASAGRMVQLARWAKALITGEPDEPAHGEIRVRVRS